MQRKGLDDGDTWVSITDLMTGLMVMFLLIALAFMAQLQQKEALLEHKDPLEAHRVMEENIYNVLQEEFEPEQAAGLVTLDSTLTLRLIDHNLKMFKRDEAVLQPSFRFALDQMLPRYLALIARDTVLPRIAEIRIEGHTDSDGNAVYNNKQGRYYSDDLFKGGKREKEAFLSYAYNLELSQRRARAVLAYIRTRPEYRNMDPKKRDRLDFLFSGVGMSYSRCLDKEGKYVFLSGKKEDKPASRRVEFKIVTSKPGEPLWDLLNAETVVP